jgi:hypothetical protein
VETTANVPVLAFPRNPKRTTATLVNDTATDVRVGYDSGVVLTGGRRGLPLKNSGGSIIWSEPRVWKGEIWVISSAAITLDGSEESDE